MATICGRIVVESNAAIFFTAVGRRLGEIVSMLLATAGMATAEAATGIFFTTVGGNVSAPGVGTGCMTMLGSSLCEFSRKLAQFLLKLTVKDNTDEFQIDRSKRKSEEKEGKRYLTSSFC
jgi:hypothetical protein